MIVIADTSPLNYLMLIGHADLLPRLFGKVLIPPAVFEELRDSETPDPVRAWIEELPLWLHVQPLRSEPDTELRYLDRGEQEAIALAEEMKADQVLLDEMEARREAARRNLPFIASYVAQHNWIGSICHRHLLVSSRLHFTFVKT